MEAWADRAIVLAARPHGEGHALVTVLAATHGAWRGLVRGGTGRRGRGVWQPGNLVDAAWSARVSDALGTLEGELADAIAARAMQTPWALAILASACAVADGALHEREAHPHCHAGLVSILERIEDGHTLLADLAIWEGLVLAELGYGLDLSSCAVTGADRGLAYVSPKSGRAVSGEAAGVWAARLMPLPAFMTGAMGVAPGDAAAGLRITGHFLERDVFGVSHRPLPPARRRLLDKVEAEPGAGVR